MSTTRKIEGYVYCDMTTLSAEWNNLGEMAFYREAMGKENEPLETPATIVIGSGDTAPRVWTEDQVKAIVKDIRGMVEYQRQFGNGHLTEGGHIDHIAAKHGIDL